MVSYDDIIDAMNVAREDGVRPTQLHLGVEETQDLLADDNLVRVNSAPASSQLQVAGLDVQQANADEMRILLAQDGDYAKYYIF